MNLRLTLIGALLALCLAAGAAQIKLESLTVGSRAYRNVTVLGFNATDVYFTHDKGISNAKLKYLEPEMQKLFNFNAEVSAQAERQQIEDNEQFTQQVAQNIQTDTLQARTLARRTAMTSPASLVDPLFENSPIGKPLPELQTGRWIGGKPQVRGKFQLIYFWAPWSLASRKFMPEMNALSAKFTKDIAFAGVVSEPSGDPETEAGVTAEFPTGIDGSGKFIAALGVTTLPQVVLADPKGIVRYLGHPGALNEKRLQELISQHAE